MSDNTTDIISMLQTEVKYPFALREAIESLDRKEKDVLIKLILKSIDARS